MRPVKLFSPLASLLAALLMSVTGCGGGGDPQPAVPAFSSLVSFGDSLSDVGTYSVGAVGLASGGKFTINTPDTRIWIEELAARLGLPPPCPAQTGLDGDRNQGFFAPVASFSQCTAYAQGGARVTEPLGPGNRLLGGPNATIGELTVPVAQQITNHLAAHGSFRGNEIVLLLVGGNDLLVQLARVERGSDAFDAIAAMAKAGAQLLAHINTIIDAGARFVVVVNLPDISISPFGLTQGGAQRELMQAMVRTFNAALRLGLSGNPRVLHVDAFARGRDYSANPARFGLTNTTIPACDLSIDRNPLQSSLLCTRMNLRPGATDRFQFADEVHPTPYGHLLLADFVSAELRRRGWIG